VQTWRVKSAHVLSQPSLPMPALAGVRVPALFAQTSPEVPTPLRRKSYLSCGSTVVAGVAGLGIHEVHAVGVVR